MNYSSENEEFLLIEHRVSGLLCVIVTDRDGTPVISAKSDDAPVDIGLATKPTFLATYTMAIDQASKLGLGKNKSIVCMYSNYQVLDCSQTFNRQSRHLLNMI